MLTSPGREGHRRASSQIRRPGRTAGARRFTPAASSLARPRPPLAGSAARSWFVDCSGFTKIVAATLRARCRPSVISARWRREAPPWSGRGKRSGLPRLARQTARSSPSEICTGAAPYSHRQAALSCGRKSQGERNSAMPPHVITFANERGGLEIDHRRPPRDCACASGHARRDRHDSRQRTMTAFQNRQATIGPWK